MICDTRRYINLEIQHMFRQSLLVEDATGGRISKQISSKMGILTSDLTWSMLSFKPHVTCFGTK